VSVFFGLFQQILFSAFFSRFYFRQFSADSIFGIASLFQPILFNKNFQDKSPRNPDPPPNAMSNLHPPRNDTWDLWNAMSVFYGIKFHKMASVVEFDEKRFWDRLYVILTKIHHLSEWIFLCEMVEPITPSLKPSDQTRKKLHDCFNFQENHEFLKQEFEMLVRHGLRKITEQVCTQHPHPIENFEQNIDDYVKWMQMFADCSPVQVRPSIETWRKICNKDFTGQFDTFEKLIQELLKSEGDCISECQPVERVTNIKSAWDKIKNCYRNDIDAKAKRVLGLKKQKI
jgi:hypothetical protein